VDVERPTPELARGVQVETSTGAFTLDFCMTSYKASTMLVADRVADVRAAAAHRRLDGAT
jgi:hypothetical protein